MALIVTEAILLRVIKYSDNSFICEALTADYGLISFIASRGSKHNQSIPNHLRIMNLVQITYYPSKSTQGLHRLKEVFFTHVYNKVNIDVKKSLAGTFISEVILNVVKVENLDNDKMYALLKGKLIYLDLQEVDELEFIIKTLYDILEVEGILPSDNHSARFDYFNLAEGCFQNVIFDSNITLNKEKSAVFLNFLEGQLPTDVGYKFGLIDDILKYLSMHIPNFKPIKSYEIVRELHR